MYIKSLELENFKRFDHLKIEFPEDITVIKGPNEKGKSSIVQAIIAALFYDPKKSNEAIRSLKAWSKDGLYKISIKFENEGENFTLEKDFEKKTAVLKNDETGDVTDDIKEIAKNLSNAGGYQNAELFLNTSCVRQGELSFIDRKQSITEALQDIISGGGISVSLNSILKRISKSKEDLRRGLEKGLAKNPGLILRLRNSVAEQTALLEEKRGNLEEKNKLSESLAKLRLQYGDIESKLKIKEYVRKNVLTNLETLEMLKKLNEEYDNIQSTLESVKNLENELADVKNEMAPLEKFEKFNNKRYVEMASEAASIFSEIKKLKHQIDALKSRGMNFKRTINLKYLAIIAFLAALGSAGMVLGAIFYVSFILMFGVLIWSVASNSIFSRVNVKNLEKTLANLAASHTKRVEELQSALSNLGVSSIDSIDEAKEKFRKLKDKSIAIQGKIEGIFRGENRQRLEERRRVIEKRIGIEESKFAANNNLKMPSREEFAKIESDIEELTRQLKSLDKEIASLEAKISDTNISGEEINASEENLFSQKEELKSAENRGRVLDILYDSLIQARQNAFSSTKTVIEEYIGKFISEITADKYSEVSIGPDMAIKVFSAEKGEYVTPEENLSRGAVEQIYLVARFALIYVLFPHERILPRPLVILDDTFSNFDNERKERTKNVVKELSHKFQIVILTCSNDYDTWGAVVDLERI